MADVQNRAIIGYDLHIRGDHDAGVETDMRILQVEHRSAPSGPRPGSTPAAHCCAPPGRCIRSRLPVRAGECAAHDWPIVTSCGATSALLTDAAFEPVGTGAAEAPLTQMSKQPASVRTSVGIQLQPSRMKNSTDTLVSAAAIVVITTAARYTGTDARPLFDLSRRGGEEEPDHFGAGIGAAWISIAACRLPT